MKDKISNYLLLLSIVLFIIACTQKCYCTDNDCGEYGSGMVVLIIGAFGIFSGGACLAWLANPLILLAWVTAKSPKFSLILSIIALTIGISFLFFDEIIRDEAGHYGKITGYKAGYYLWNLSFISMIVRNYLKLKHRN